MLLFNQNATPIDVTVEFFGQAGAKLAETTRTIGGLTRDDVWAKELPALDEPGVLDPCDIHARRSWPNGPCTGAG